MAEPRPAVTIDGAYGAGGGQILRTALALACLTGQPVQVVNIRAGRKNPGLAPQHLTGVRAIAEVCRAQVEGDALGSQTLRFTPGGPAVPGAYRWDVTEAAGQGSAGSVSLILQTVLFPLLMAPGASTLTIRGGTHVSFSPPVHYVRDVFLPSLQLAGEPVRVELGAWGWYPRGGGEITVAIAGPARLRPLTMDARGPLEKVSGVAAVTNLPAHIPQRMVNRARGALRDLGVPLEIAPLRARGPAPGAGIFLTAHYTNARAGFSALGRPGKASEAVAEEACDALLAHHQSDAAADLHLADQLALPCALAEGESVITTPEVTAHLTTNLHVIQQFLRAEIALTGKIGASGRMTIRGWA
ncbi:MAG: RNA 3'-terminal phosphate cyclase [Anaerolineae bacterium]|nr:RNA 3'-terminal phosphate cyclase [Anaerolineae bacterium]